MIRPSSGRSGAGRPGPAHLPLAQDLDRRAAARARRSTPSRSCCARRACSTGRILYATDINARGAARRRDAGIYPLERMRRSRRTTGRPGRRCSLSELLHRRPTARAVFDRSLCQNVGLLRPQPRDRQRLRRGAGRARAATCSSTSSARCRSARSLSSRTPCRVRGFFGLGAKETLRFSAHGADFDVFARERWYRRA